VGGAKRRVWLLTFCGLVALAAALALALALPRRGSDSSAARSSGSGAPHPKSPIEAPALVDLGSMRADTKVRFSFEIRNIASAPLSVGIRSLCPCLSLDATEAVLEPQARFLVEGSLDTRGLALTVERGILLDLAGPSRERRMVTLRATLPADPKAQGCVECEELKERFKGQQAAQAAPEPAVELFMAPDCAECLRFLAEAERARSASAGSFALLKHSAYDPATLDYLDSRLSSLGAKLSGFPVLIVGSRVLQGEDVYREGLKALAALR
jgi:hypothetical protein